MISFLNTIGTNLLIELRESICVYSPIFHNSSGLSAGLAMSEAVNLSLLQFSILIWHYFSCLVVKLFCWMVKAKLKQDLYNKTCNFFVSPKVSHIPRELTLKQCTTFYRTFVSVSHLDESQPLLDQFALCESVRECFLSTWLSLGTLFIVSPFPLWPHHLLEQNMHLYTQDESRQWF